MNIIKQIRKENNLSQSDFAKILNVHQTAVSQWENGRTSPDISSAKLISHKFGVSLDVLLGDIYTLAEEKYYLDKFSALTIEEQKHFFEVALSEQEQHLISGFRSLNEQGQEYILDTINLAMLKYAVSNEPALRIAAAPDITPAKIDIDSDEVKHS